MCIVFLLGEVIYTYGHITIKPYLSMVFKSIS